MKADFEALVGRPARKFCGTGRARARAGMGRAGMYILRALRRKTRALSDGRTPPSHIGARCRLSLHWRSV